MRTWILSLLTLVLAVACGPSNKELSGAKTARYRADPVKLFAEVKGVVEGKYKLEKVDESTLGMMTTAKWYSPDGIVAPRQDDVRLLDDRSLNVRLVVTLVPVDGDYVVKVEPKTLRYIVGRPNPDIVEPTDQTLAGWVRSRADQLAYDIYEQIKGYEVKTAGPAVVTPGAVAPTTPPPADPAAGSGSDAAPAPAPTTP